MKSEVNTTTVSSLSYWTQSCFYLLNTRVYPTDVLDKTISFEIKEIAFILVISINI